jgi:hypothetical protein
LKLDWFVTSCFLTISVPLQTVFVADAHIAEGQTLFEDTAVIKGKSKKIQIGTRTQTVSSKEGKNLEPL